MSSDPGWELLSRIVQYDILPDVQGRGVTADMFATDYQQRAFAFIDQHVRQYGGMPSIDLLTKKFRRGQFSVTVEDSTAYYVDQFIDQHLRVHLKDLLLEMAGSASDNPRDVLEEMRGMSGKLLGKAVEVTDVAHEANRRQRLRDYRMRMRGEGLGILSPWETFNAMTFGYQPEDFIVVSARPGVGKTFFVCLLALWCAYKEACNVLFVTKEMATQAIQRRMDAMWFELPYNAFRGGYLTPAQEQAFIGGLRLQKQMVESGKWGKITIIGNVDNFAGVGAKCEQHKPDVLIIDGLYLLYDKGESDDKHRRVANVSTETKRLAQRFRIPVIGTSQIHRIPGNLERSFNSLNLGDLAFSDALAQDADIVLALIITEAMRENRQLYVRDLKTREDETRDWGVHWDLGTMENTFHELPVEEGAFVLDVEASEDGLVEFDDGGNNGGTSASEGTDS